MAFHRKRTILVKIESVEGTDPVPTGMANAIRCGEITVTPIAGDMAGREFAFPDFGSVADMLSNQHVMLSFRVELQGSGAAGTPPQWGVLHRACAHSETITAATKVEYVPISASQESAGIYMNQSGTVHKVIGSRGNLTYNFAKGVPYIQYDMFGRWSPPAAQAMPAIDVSGFPEPYTVGVVNTPTFTVDGYAAVLDSLSLKVDNLARHTDRPNAAAVLTPGRAITGQMAFVAPALGTKDFFGIAVAKPPQLVARQLIHGIAAGKIIQLDEPALQIIQPGYVDLDGETGLSMQTKTHRSGSTGDNEYKLTVR